MIRVEFKNKIEKYINEYGKKVLPYRLFYSFNDTSFSFVDSYYKKEGFYLVINVQKAFQSLHKSDDYYLLNYKAIIAKRIAFQFLNFINIEDDVIQMKKISEDDLDDLYEITQNENIMIPDACTVTKTLADARKRLKQLMNKEHCYGIYLKENGKMIGTFSVVKEERVSLSAEIGYSINEDYQRRGYAKRAINLIKNVLFEKLDFDLIIAYTFPDNVKSINLLKSQGFIQEGIIKKKIHRFKVGGTDVVSLYLENKSK